AAPEWAFPSCAKASSEWADGLGCNRRPARAAAFGSNCKTTQLNSHPMASGSIIDRSQFNRQTILLVEDNDDDVFIMQNTFRRSGIPNPLQVVSDGEQAIDYLKGTGPYSDREKYPLPVILLLDLNMPKKNGFEL